MRMHNVPKRRYGSGEGEGKSAHKRSWRLQAKRKATAIGGYGGGKRWKGGEVINVVFFVHCITS